MAGRRVGDGLLGDLFGIALRGPGDGGGDAVVPEPQLGLDRTRADGVDPHSLRAELVQKLVSAPLATPSAASARAIARPIPLLAPVTTATLPDRFKSMMGCSDSCHWHHPIRSSTTKPLAGITNPRVPPLAHSAALMFPTLEPPYIAESLLKHSRHPAPPRDE